MQNPQLKNTFSCRTPYVTGTSVLGITYKDGVMIAADTLGAFICFGKSALWMREFDAQKWSFHACKE